MRRPLELALAALITGAVPAPAAPQESAADELRPAPHARVDVARDLADAQVRGRHPTDGVGRALLLEGGAVEAGGSGRWTIAFEAGPAGVAEGGGVYLQVSPFWGWSTPQVVDPRAPGFTRVETDAQGVVLEPVTLDRQLLAVTLRGRALAAGERIVFRYGAGPAGARADDHAEACSRFWVAVDGDGDGVRAVIEDSPCVAVLPGTPARLIVHVPSVTRPGESLRAMVAVLDAGANAVREVSGRLRLAWDDEEAAAHEGELTLEDGGAQDLVLDAPPGGLHRLRATLELAGGPLEAESNPTDVVERAPRVLWADLHGHSADSDGSGTPDDYFRYARDVAGLDVAALTDHDHWGMLFLDEHPDLWARSVAAARSAERPGRFLALPGYEWTSWIWGHRHVLFFGDRTPLLSSIDPDHDTPSELWEALRGLPAVTLPHHPAGGPVAIDWRVPPDPALDVAVEVCSAHGSSEAREGPHPIYAAVDGCWVRDALAGGVVQGFVASGDGHDGHPGLAHLGRHYPTGGVAAILADAPTREGVLAALRSRRTYATSGERMLLRFALGGARMGESLVAGEQGRDADLFVACAGTAPLRQVVVVRSGVALDPLPGDGGRDLELAGVLEDLRPGEWVYVRVEQTDGHAAWSSPIWVR